MKNTKEAAILGVLVVQHFHSNSVARALINRAEDAPESTDSDLLDDPVVAEFLR